MHKIYLESTNGSCFTTLHKRISSFKKEAFMLLMLGLVSSSGYSNEKLKNDKVEVLVTSSDRKYDLKQFEIPLKNSSDPSADITVDNNIQFQSIDGFGAAITGSTSYNLLQMDKGDRERFLKETFDPVSGYGHSYIRISIGCSDFSLSEYTLCDKPGLENFALQEEELRYVIPVLKEILAINPDIKIIGSPWTPPRWMKVNDLNELAPFMSWTSGQLNPKYYSDYGEYFVLWIKSFQDAGIPIYAVTPQNEPLNRKNSASLFMGWKEQLDFIKYSLGPKIQSSGFNTKIYAFDHNYNYDNMEDQQSYPLNIYQDPAADMYLAGAAYHNYGGNKNELLKIHDARPDKELIFTETSIGTWNKGKDLSIRLIEDMEQVGLGTINNYSKAVIVWNLMLDSDRGPWREGGCKTCYGAVDIDRNDYKTITRNSHYYILSHLSWVVKPGAVRVSSEFKGTPGIISSAFYNKDGSSALVLLNKEQKAQKISVSDGNKKFAYQLPARSVVSFKWKS